MISSKFYDYLNNFPHLLKFCGGIFAKDRIPNKIKDGYFFICNTDSSDGPGIHWFCLIRLGHSIECFDSLGIDKEKKEFLLSLPLFQQSFVRELELNTTQVQSSESSLCGEFTLFFIINRLHNQDLSFSILINEIFVYSQTSNETYVLNFCKEHFET